MRSSDINLIEKLLQHQIKVELKAQGNSMLPDIPSGSSLSIHPLPQPLTKNMVCLYKNGEELILHRVIHINRELNSIILCGDNNPEPDRAVSQEQIMGYLPDYQLLIFKFLINIYHPGSDKVFDFNLIPNLSEFFQTATKMGIAGQLATYLDSVDDKVALGSAQALEIQHLRIQTYIRNGILLHNLKKIRQGFNESGIVSSPIKGMWLLSHKAFQDFSRPSSDIDLLVRNEHLSQAGQILLDFGYEQVPDKSGCLKLHTDPGAHHLPPFRKDGISVELHGICFPGSPAWLQKRILSKQDIESHFLVSIFHFTRHYSRGDRQFKWLIDILRLAGQLPINNIKHTEVNYPDLPWDIFSRELITLISDWREKPDQSLLADKLSSILRSNSRQKTESQRLIRASYPPTIKGLRHIWISFFPALAYLRYIYPHLNGSSSVRLYLYRWQSLMLRFLSITFRSLVIF